MAAQQAHHPIGYHLPEAAHGRLELVRDSLKLLMHCAEDGQQGTIAPLLLASHLQLLIEEMNRALEQTVWMGKGA